MEQVPSFSQRPESSVLTDKEKVYSALEHTIEGEALNLWMAMKVAGTPESNFVKWIADFNATSAEDRGKDKYDHSRPLTEHVDVSVPFTSPSGHSYAVTLHKNGEVTLQMLGQ